MDAPNNIVLVSQHSTVSPRSPISSARYNDFVHQTAADLINIQTQINRILIGVNTGTDSTEVWTNGQGIDGKGIYFDSQAATPESIYDHVTAIENTIANLSTSLTLNASQINFDSSTLAGWETYTTVQSALSNVIQTLGINTGSGITTINLSNINVNEGFTMENASDGHSIGSNAIPWDGGHFVNLNVSGTLTVGGVEISAAGLGTTAETVSYTATGTLPHLDASITTVQEALDTLGNLDLDQTFPRAGQPIKRIPAVGDIVGTAGNTVAEWLQALFFPFLEGTADITFQNYFLAEVGQDLTDLQLKSNIVVDSNDSIVSSYIRYGAHGANFNNPSEYTEQAVTITIPTNADDPKTIETIHPISGTISDDTSFKLYVLFDNEGSATMKTDMVSLFFYNRVMWMQRGPAFTPTPTVFWNAAQSQGNHLPVSHQPPASITVTPNTEYVFLAIPVRYGKYITAIGDPNITGTTGALGSWEICTSLPSVEGDPIPTTSTLAADNSVIVPSTSGYHTQLNGIADLNLYDFIIYKTVSALDSGGVPVTFNFNYGTF